MELWKDIEGYEGRYQVSNEGRVKSVKRLVPNGKNRLITVHEKILKNCVFTKTKYEYVKLYLNGNRKNILIHRLVAETWIPNPENKPCVGHKDCNTHNNSVVNLYWCTYEENNNHPITKERQSKAKEGKPSNNSGHKWTLKTRDKHIEHIKRVKKTIYQYTLNENLLKIWDSIIDIEKECGFARAAISYCCNGKRKTAYDYIWSFEPL